MQGTPGGDQAAIAVAIVVGGSEAVREEYQAAKALCEGLDVTVFVANDMIAEFPDHIHHAVTLHPSKIARWLAERKQVNGSGPERIWSTPPERRMKQRHGSSFKWAHVTDYLDALSQISSGDYGVMIARHLGFTKIILAGVPLTREGGHFRRHKQWLWALIPQRQCAQRVAELKPFVRSMSGWTRQQFGYPDCIWLET